MTDEAFLQRVFDCTPAVAAEILRHAAIRTYLRSATIIRQGEPCDDIYLLVLGRARCYAIAANGMLVRFCDFLSGDFFGRLDASASPESLQEIAAVEPVEVATFRGADFLLLMDAHGCVGRALSRALIRQLEHLSHQMLSRTTLSAAGRVHEELLRLAEEGGGRIAPPPVLAELAACIHSTRETVSRTISALERRGIVRRDPDALVIVAPRRLAEMIF